MNNKIFSIEANARALFGEQRFKKLMDWYRYARDFQGDYVVFLARRSYLLALIMEELVEDGNRKEKLYLTDAAFYLLCEKIAADYRERQCFPRMLICDDILIHGRNMNHFLKIMEERVCELLAAYYDTARVSADFVDSVEIHIFQCTKSPLLLIEKYKPRVHITDGFREKSVWRETSYLISLLISCANITNATYVYSEYLSDDEFYRIEKKFGLKDFIKTRYQNIQEYARVNFVRDGSKVKAIMTLRIIKNFETSGYRVAPFVFLPNIGKPETDNLYEDVLKRFTDNPNLREWMGRLREVPGQRSFNEVLTLILSNAILQDFHKEYRIDSQTEVFLQNKIFELEKLAGNYCFGNWTEAKNHLKCLVDAELYTIVELEKLFLNVLPEDKSMVESVEWQDYPLSEEQIQSLRESVEDYFYKLGFAAEENAQELGKMAYYTEDMQSKREVLDGDAGFHELLKQQTSAKIKYKIAMVLQMMDAGILSFSSYARNVKEVAGYSQFLKAGEQAMLIYPLRVYEYLPMLVALYRKCIQWSWDIKAKLEELMHSECWYRWKEESIEEEYRKLTEFLDKLVKIGETPEEWNGNYILSKQIGFSTDKLKVEELQRVFDLQRKYVKSFETFIAGRHS